MQLSWWDSTRRWLGPATLRKREPRIGLALGGGFARGIAHLGVLRVFERYQIPIHAISGVSSGSIVAAAFASGTAVSDIELLARSMKFSDVARWRINRLGLAGNERMIPFLNRLLKADRFENMRIPLAVVATDLGSGKPVVFRDHGEVIAPIRASCSFPGLFPPLLYQDRSLVDGFVGVEVPTLPLRRMGASHIIAVNIPNPASYVDADSMFAVIDRCFQVMSRRLEGEWRRVADIVITPDVSQIPWDSFVSASQMIQAGEKAALAALPAIKRWLAPAEQPKALESAVPVQTPAH